VKKLGILMSSKQGPAGNIGKRWTVDARDTLPVHLIEDGSQGCRKPKVV
jgi:hypothetical protein